MIPMTLPEIAEIVGGTVVHDDGVTVDGPSFLDSRVAERRGLFVAIAGERGDGHDYARSALAAGAAAVLSSRDTGQPGVVVEDPVAALAALARHSLATLRSTCDLRVVALTGSQGKTSAKDVLAQVLAAAGTTVATYGSFNNELGLPLTVLRADSATRFLVLEMGARHVGDLTASCAVASPLVSLVLNVGKAHIGEFGSQEAIARAKGEIVEALPPAAEGGVAVLNADDPLVSAMASRTSARVTRFGTHRDADVRFEDVRLDDLGRATYDLVVGGARRTVSLGLIGEHHATNTAAVVATALALDVPLDTVVDALATVTATSPARMELFERADGITVINDAFNANPDSMRAALKTLAAIGRGRPSARTVAVLGEMLELGGASRDEHDAVGRLVVRLDIHQLVVVGQGAKPIHLGACLEGSWGGESVFVPDPDAALAWLRANLVPGDVVLFKSSKAAQVRRVADAVMADGADEPALSEENRR